MFWRKNMGAKAACKMLLVKLKTNFDIFERTFEIANILENRKTENDFGYFIENKKVLL
jgi:hypothetical protein